MLSDALEVEGATCGENARTSMLQRELRTCIYTSSSTCYKHERHAHRLTVQLRIWRHAEQYLGEMVVYSNEGSYPRSKQVLTL